MIFIDTSAFYALIDFSDVQHDSAAQAWTTIREQPEQLACSNYILVETIALLQNRFGMPAVQDFIRLTNRMSVFWFGIEQHRLAIAALLTAGRRGLSLVDCTSFETMRSHGILTAFTFDPHFKEQGFTSIP
jgi:predicted nucleic acid-binding protein